MQQYVIIGMKDIAKAIGKHPNTLRNWIRKRGFPVCLDPSGCYITTPGLIDGWIMARLHEQRGKLVDRYGQ